MAEGRVLTKLLENWTASWQSLSSPMNTSDSTSIQWCAPRNRIRPGSKRTQAVLHEHPLNAGDDKYEYDLLLRWSRGDLHSGPTDRTNFSRQQLEEAVQEEGADNALTTLAELLKDYMVFNEDGKLAENMTYVGGWYRSRPPWKFWLGCVTPNASSVSHYQRHNNSLTTSMNTQQLSQPAS